MHYNLFAGTVVALGSEEHFDVLETASNRGEIGCNFCLTEKYAGVNSGLVVETTAEYDEKTKEFVFHSNSEGAKEKLDFSRVSCRLGGYSCKINNV